MQLSELRRKDAQRVRELVLPIPDDSPRSLIIQGLPGCGVEPVFASLCDSLRAGWSQVGERVLIEANVAAFWVEPVANLVRFMRRELRSTPSGGDTSEKTEDGQGRLEAELIGLRQDVLHHARQEGQVIFMLHNFDALLKFPDPDQAQHLLNTLQSLGYEHRYRTAFVVLCHRDIEDICQRVNYSDFYKIFGANHHRVSRVSDQEIENYVRVNSPEHDSRQRKTIVALSAGYPEHADLLLRYSGSETEIRKQAVDALALTFEEWVNCLTASEQQVLQLVAQEQTLGYEHVFAQKKLLRKEILIETDIGIRMASPLFAAYLSARVGKTQGSQMPCVRKASLLSDVHCTLLEQLFQGKHYLDWSLLQSPRPGDATVYLISGEDRQGVKYRPCIVKIHRSDMIDHELSKTEKARALLGPVVPTVLAQASLKGQKAVAFEYATGDNRSYEARQFGEFYQTEPPEQITGLLCKLFNQVLWPFYRAQRLKSRSASRLYFLPRPERGEFDKLAEIARRSHLYDAKCDKFVLPHQPVSLTNPATVLQSVSNDPESPYHRLFLEKRHAGLCLVHGDVNPRNLLIDGIGNVYIIDFAAMKEEGGRFLDIARLEAEIKFKLTDVGSTREEILSLMAVERLLVDAVDDVALTMVVNLPFMEKIAKMVGAVVTLRQIACSMCQGGTDDTTFELEYKTAVLAHTLRICLYEDYLDQSQQEFAIISAAMLVDRLLTLLDERPNANMPDIT